MALLPDFYYRHGGTIGNFGLDLFYAADRRRRRRHHTTIDEWVHQKVEEAEQRPYESPGFPDPILPLGGGDVVPVVTTVPAGPAEYEGEEVCWVDTVGDIRCWIEGSIWAPGQVWGPPASDYTRLPAEAPAPADYEIIDPEEAPTERVFEPPVAAPPPVEEAPMASFTDSLFDLAGQFISSQFAPSPTVVAPPATTVAAVAGPSYSGSCAPRKTRTLTIDCATGQEVKRTRRRRRRLLTSGDLGDLAQLQALVGKGSNAMQVAVSKAIR